MLQWTEVNIEQRGGDFHARSYETTPAAARKHVKLGVSKGLFIYEPTGTDNLWYGFRMNTSGTTLHFSTTAASATPESATLQNMLSIRHNRLGFYGTTPVDRPILSYSRTGETVPEAALRRALAALGLVTDSTTA